MTPAINAEALLDDVVSELDLRDFGDDRYVEDYRHALAALQDELALTPMGIAMLDGWTRTALTNVLRMNRDLAAHPEIRDEILAPPIVITGFARTGTTKLQRMVSASPATQSLLLWKLLNPAPFPDTDPYGRDPRIDFALESARMVEQHFPEFWAAHPQPALDADEDFLLHDMTFAAPTLGMRFGAMGLMKALTPTDVRVFEFLRTVLQYLQWQDGSPDRSSRPWVLKSPIHIGNVAALRKVFPGATFVFCHRDVETVMASLCSLIALANRMVTGDVDRPRLGREVLAYWAEEWTRNLRQRADLDPGSYCDLRFDAINADAVAAVEQVHTLAGLSFDDDARRAAEQWQRDNPRHGGGEHRYDLADFDLTGAQVREAFAPYYEFFAGSDVLA